MSFNRSGYIGRAPGDSSIVLAKQYFQPTGAGKTFTFTAGYDPGLIDVYRNGVKLVNVLDYAATDGSTIILDTPVGVGSTVQVVAYKGFNLAEVNSSGADFNVGTNLYVQSGFGSFSQGITANQIDVSGIGTIGIGSFVDVNISGAATVAGTLVANSFSGDGSALTGLANTAYIVSVATTTADLKVSAASTFGGITKVSSTTDSTSSSTGALVVSGGAGIGGNVYIGAGLSVAGTLTYEDVTSVDSVGMVTAKSGVNVSGGQLTVGSGITMGIAGVATFSGTSDVHLLDNVQLNVGDGSDLAIYHDGSDSRITNSTGALQITGNNDFRIKTNGGQNIFKATGNLVELYYDTGSGGSNKKFETTNDGTVTTGIGTFTAGLEINADSKYLKIGASNDIEIWHDGTDSNIRNNTGTLLLRGSSIVLKSNDAGETLATFTDDGSVELRYDNSKKFETTNDGVVITGICTDSLGNVRDIPLRSVTGSAATLVVGDAGKVVSTNTTGWTVPASTFSEGDTVSLLNNSAGDLTITCSAVTTYLTSDGSTVTSSTLGARGMATLYFVSASVAYLQGTALS